MHRNQKITNSAIKVSFFGRERETIRNSAITMMVYERLLSLSDFARSTYVNLGVVQ
jgi:hypothetical protein